MRVLKQIVAVVITLFSVQLLAQDSFIRGTIIEEETGMPLIGVSVVIDGTTTGSATDLDGKFNIPVEAGTYGITVSFISFTKLQVKDIIVKEGEPTLLGELFLKSASEQLEEFVVTAKAVTNTEAAMVTMKKKSASLIDGISAASFKKVGDSDAAGAMARVTGVSVQGGKYVYVRGLGDRYTKTTLNGVDVPGLDPDRNTVQMDIFPTNVINNIVVSKSFTADLPADFTGGAVDIELKDFPEQKTATIGIGFGYNPSMNLNSNYITYGGSSTDFLGFDNGKREIPTDGNTDVALRGDIIGQENSAKGQEFQRILRDFDPQMRGYRANSGLNTSLSASFANQKSISKGRTLGFIVGASYKNDYEYYEDAEFNLYAKPNQKDETELIARSKQVGDFGVNNVLLGAMAGVALKSESSKYRLNILHLQNGEKKAGEFDFMNNNQGAVYNANQYNLEYSERSLTNVLINGTHQMRDNLKVDWRVSPTRSAIQDPDIRFTRFRKDDEGRVSPILGTEAGLPQRIWRWLEEYNVAGKTDVTYDHKWLEDDAKLKVGASYTYKTRDFNIHGFKILPGDKQIESTDPNDIFDEEKLFDADDRNGVHHEADFVGLSNPNEYTSSVSHAGVYVSEEFRPLPLLKAIIGVRAEMFNMYYTGTNRNRTIVYDNEQVLNDLDLFPTANLIYSLRETQNLRGSYSRTIARPSFKEKSFAEISDPITGRNFIGGGFAEVSVQNGDTSVLWNGDLQSTHIDNFDLRWEIYPGIGESFSVGAFYKRFKNPIEIVQFISSPGNFQPRNVGDAQVYGVEIEAIKSLKFITESLKDFQFNTNVTLVHSVIEMSEAEQFSRQNSARDGEKVETTRAMAGQAPYIVNFGLSYNGREKGTQANVSYNVQGETLEFVGFGNQTDVYTKPFHNLSLKVSQAFLEDDRLNVSFKVSNLLADDKEKVFRSYEAQDQIFSRLSPQRTFSLSLSYTLK